LFEKDVQENKEVILNIDICTKIKAIPALEIQGVLRNMGI